MKAKKQRVILWHIIAWFLYATFNHLINCVQAGTPNVYITDTIGKYSIAAFIFYSNVLFIFPSFFAKKRYFLLAISLVTLSIVSWFLKSVLYHKVFIYFGYPKVVVYTLLDSYIMNIWWWFQYTILGFGYWFAIELIESTKEKAQLENEKIKAEYGYLKAQINPHFLYNALNFFYSKTLDISEDVANGILSLAEIMRFVVSNDEDEFGRIPLSKEIEQVKNVISINQLRFDNELKIDFVTKNEHKDVRVIPFILITLVENAFKHGDILSNQAPISIIIDYAKNSKQLRIFVCNKKGKDRSNYSLGTGLANLKKRLDLVYTNRYNLSIDEDESKFSVDLLINV
ncbi:MAG TPA: histidine kinase [Chitinophaga sp.]|uniref:sensor histidine kinase n=1 Tax=Chitinophaga sp. TaxID=1869181 RepID=UPI002D06E1BF|nr:histidine kinase [Chitinophaga sp.]HVI47250.1 histidine kinase [Chitinophaga sp.]